MTGARILGAAVGDCVHVGGLLNFLALADQNGYDTTFLGPAVSIPALISAVIESDPDIIAVSYRLTPEAAGRLLTDLTSAVREAGLSGKRFVFGGTGPVCLEAEKTGLFEQTFGGEALVEDVIAYLKGTSRKASTEDMPDGLIGRIEWRSPHPIIRHHFGLPSMEQTVRGIERIADSRLVDVISLGPDQNTQACFFRPEEMDRSQDGAGGVPIRTEDDFRTLFSAAQRGNRPLLRSYSGTRNLLRMADVLVQTVHNAWCAVPLCWYSVLDGRSRRGVVEAIRENQQTMRWHAQRSIPVEVNEAHHWSLRDAPDTVAVAAAYLAAHTARSMGVRDYVCQLMFNTPAATWIDADLGKMLAKLDLIERLAGPDFRIWRQTRAGLASYPADQKVAKGQLGSSVFVQMALRPHIVHVVGFSEADHAATADDVIESCAIARGVIANCLRGLPDLTADDVVQQRRRELVAEADILLDAIRELGRGCDDPLTDPQTLADAIRVGLLDAPHLAGNPHAAGRVKTSMKGGRAQAVGPSGTLSESQRIAGLTDRP